MTAYWTNLLLALIGVGLTQVFLLCVLIWVLMSVERMIERVARTSIGADAQHQRESPSAGSTSGMWDD